MIILTIDQTADRLVHWISLIGKREEVVVIDREQPVARITRCEVPIGLRPQVGTLTSAPVNYHEDCFAPLSGEALTEWGL